MKIPDKSSQHLVVFTMGGKGGPGKTTSTVSVVDWYRHKNISVKLIDADTENKKRGSLAFFFKEARKLDIHQERGLDSITDAVMTGESGITLCDLGSSAGADTFQWFDQMYEPLHAENVRFTAIGVVTTSLATVESVLQWKDHLKNRVNYIIIQNHRDGSQFDYLTGTDQGESFLKESGAIIVNLEKRASDIQNELDNYGLSLGRYLQEPLDTLSDELKRGSTILRSRGCFNRFNQEIGKAEKFLVI